MHILIVDDNAPLANNLAEILEHEGHQVATATSSEEALTLAKKIELEGALLDIRMPGMDGIELFERLQAMHPGAVYCLMTAHTVDDRVQRAVDDGVKTVLAKPISVNALLACVRATDREQPASSEVVATKP